MSFIHLLAVSENGLENHISPPYFLSYICTQLKQPDCCQNSRGMHNVTEYE